MSQPESRPACSELRRKLRVEHRVRRRTCVEIAMTLRGMALRRLYALSRALSRMTSPHPDSAARLPTCPCPRTRGARSATHRHRRDSAVSVCSRSASRWSSLQGYGVRRLGSRDPMTSVAPIVERLRQQSATPAEPQTRCRRVCARHRCCCSVTPRHPRCPLLFVLRSEELRQHPGQIAFPGGGAEAFDSDVVATAIREAGEELGIQADQRRGAWVAVALLDGGVRCAGSRRWSGCSAGRSTSRTDDFEIAEWFRIDIADLLVAPHTPFARSNATVMRGRIHYYETSGRVIWGVTGAIVHELLERLGRTD